MTGDDWQVVEEALPSMEGHEPNCPCSVGRAHAALARLREREAQLGNELVRERAKDGGTFDQWHRLQVAEARVAELEGVAGGVVWLDNNIHNYGTDGWREFFKAVLRDARRALAHKEETP